MLCNDAILEYDDATLTEAASPFLNLCSMFCCYSVQPPQLRLLCYCGEGRLPLSIKVDMVMLVALIAGRALFLQVILTH